MIKNPKFTMVNGNKYEINTDFRVALKCEKIAQDINIDDTERALAIIYLLFGEKGLTNKNDWEKLIKIVTKFLSCGNKKTDFDKDDIDMDYIQDEKYIKVSFLQEYGIDLSKVPLHWWDFFDMLNGLSDKTVLSRVREIRNFDIKDIKDTKEREKWIKAKKQVALEKETKKPNEQQIQNMKDILSALGLKV